MASIDRRRTAKGESTIEVQRRRGQRTRGVSHVPHKDRR